MKTRITNSDIDALVETTGLLMTLAKKEPKGELSGKMRNLASHLRKIYILMLHASGLHIQDLQQMFFPGIDTDPELAKAIDALCPHMDETSISE